MTLEKALFCIYFLILSQCGNLFVLSFHSSSTIPKRTASYNQRIHRDVEVANLLTPAREAAVSAESAASRFSTAQSRFSTAQYMASADSEPSVTLYGHTGTRSPLVNWAMYELNIPFQMADDLSTNPHPFGQLPCLTSKDGAVLFESGAILQYLHVMYGMDKLSPAQRAAVMSWITWANASLDPICFLETPDGKVYDTGLKKPNRRIARLNDMLTNQKYLVPTETKDDGDNSVFTVADVAVASYLLYVLQFFPDVNLQSQWPAVVRYMIDCASRPCYQKAFGDRVQGYLVQSLKQQQQEGGKDKKIFGMF